MPPSLSPLRARVALVEPLLGPVARDVALAFDYAEADPEGAVAKARRATEGLLLDALAREKRRPAGQLALDALKAQLHGVIPRKVLAHVEQVQRLGNEGAHARADRLDAGDAHAALASLVQVIDWYVARYHAKRRKRGGVLPWLLATGAFGAAGVGVAAVVAWGPAPPRPALPPAPVVTAAEVAPAGVATPVARPTWVAWSRPLTVREERAHAEGVELRGVARACMPLPSEPPIVREEVAGWVRLEGSCVGWARAGQLPPGPPPPEPDAAEVAALRAEAEAAEDPVDAIPLWSAAIARAPADPVLRAGRGVARYRAGELPEAMEDLALCIALDRLSAACRHAAALTEKELGLPWWEDDLEAALALDPSLAPSPGSVAAHADVPLYDEPPRKRFLRKKPRPRCLLAEGEPVEVVTEGPAWLEVRSRCGDVEVSGFVPADQVKSAGADEP
ncbi:MAG: DUF4145 domain-containing protein [Myxococcota bacterium]